MTDVQERTLPLTIAGRPVTLAEALAAERAQALRQYETRLMIAIEQARRAAVRRGLDSRAVVCAIVLDARVCELYCEAIRAACASGLVWLAVYNTNPDIEGQAHFDAARHEALAMLLSLAQRIV
jgi:hypothetical protein